jgi:rhodanese-related sulfurtransferase
MKMWNNFSVLFKEIFLLVILSIFASLLFNYFSGKQFPLIRKPDVKVQASDSLLFSESSTIVDTSLLVQPDTSITKNIKVIAPLHEHALRNNDSSSNKPAQTYTIISLDQLQRLIKQKRGMLIDARNEDDYNRGHIASAHNIPALEIDKYFSQLVPIPRDTLMILYCNNAECHLAHLLADFLRDLEFKKIFIYENGWDGWIESRQPIDSTKEGG